jgi:hypothetical protein
MSCRIPSLSLAVFACAAAALLGSASAARAASNSDVTVSESLSSIPQNSAITLLDLGTSSSSGLVGNAPISILGGSAQVTFTAASGVYSGTTTGVAAAPFTASGPDNSNYLAAEPKGSVTVSFNSQQKYFGLLWGSVDNYNSLNFYNNGTLVETLTGSAISANANGNQTASGSYIVNLDFNGTASFNSVVATSSTPAFEFDSIAYAATPVPITGAAIASAGYLGQTNVIVVNPAPIRLPGASPVGIAILAGSALWRLRRRGEAGSGRFPVRRLRGFLLTLAGHRGS